MATKLLLVEDDEFVQRMYQRELTMAGYAVAVHGDSTTVFDYVRNDRPDVIILDIMMPKLNGIDLLNQLKGADETKDVPVIMLSARDDPDLFKLSHNLGASGYLVKSKAELSDIIIMIDAVRPKTEGKDQPA